MSAHITLVTKYLNRWRTLQAWGTFLEGVDLLVSDREYAKGAGQCWPSLQKINVYHQPGLSGMLGMLKTGLHEFAHVVEKNDGHGIRWQQRYSTAVTEVTNYFVGWGFEDLDERCYRAMLRWWRASGAEAEAKLLLNGRNP